MMRSHLFLLLALLPLLIDAFAAKKKGGKKRPSARPTKGFGAAPPSFEQVVGKFRTRMPEDAEQQDCPCGSGKLYSDCCAPFHRGQPCRTMTDVLRSRYTAFSWRLIAHVVATTHETCRDYQEDRIEWAKELNKNGMFDSYEFVGLEAGSEEPGPDENTGFIEFKVTLRAKEDKGSAIAGKETVIAERSQFLRDPEEGSWSYASGEVRSEETGLEGAVLNN